MHKRGGLYHSVIRVLVQLETRDTAKAETTRERRAASGSWWSQCLAGHNEISSTLRKPSSSAAAITVIPFVPLH